VAVQPEIVQRSEQAYVAIKALVTMQTFDEVTPRLHSEVRGWLRSQGVEPAGRPFLKFNVIDMDRQLEIEAGFGVAAPLTGDDRVLAGVLAAGRYATLWHIGHPDGLIDTTRTLRDWATQQGLTWDMTLTPDGEQWRCRLETYYDEPGQDMNDWKTELAFKLAD
jgi:effector-binding domain-containing protein